MFEVVDIITGKPMRNFSTEASAWDWINYHDYITAERYYIRLNEDRWPEYESVMEMEKYQ